ncbi:hypothetical protein E2C01_016404 [Portunus trituberculatus]|uniref:Uncharacterized protein n=1 Tax=Portunus trituberculatus TaxID=210409 RepID=A0A5B7DPB2_PORTR|nr:hypothetical protein [Portunus trituberculatus]
MEVASRSSNFPGKAGPKWLGMLLVPSVVPEETLEGSIRSTWHTSRGPDFLAKTQLPGDESLSNFTIPALTEYIGDSEGDQLLCPVRAVRDYLHRTRDCCPRCSRLFWHVVHSHTVSHWICQVFQHAHEDVSEKDMNLDWVKAHEGKAVTTSALFKKIWSIPAILWAGTWKSMFTFASFYLRDITHKYLDTFSVGSVVSALRVIQ